MHNAIFALAVALRLHFCYRHRRHIKFSDAIASYLSHRYCVMCCCALGQTLIFHHLDFIRWHGSCLHGAAHIQPTTEHVKYIYLFRVFLFHIWKMPVLHKQWWCCCYCSIEYAQWIDPMGVQPKKRRVAKHTHTERRRRKKSIRIFFGWRWQGREMR